MKKTVLLDLDGVLNEYDGNFDENFIPNPKEGAREFLSAVSKNYIIKLFTTRNKILTAKWLIKNNLDEFIEDITNIKEPAYLYIDDRCIRFNGDFDELKNQIDNFKPHYKS